MRQLPPPGDEYPSRNRQQSPMCDPHPINEGGLSFRQPSNLMHELFPPPGQDDQSPQSSAEAPHTRSLPPVRSESTELGPPHSSLLLAEPSEHSIPPPANKECSVPSPPPAPEWKEHPSPASSPMTNHPSAVKAIGSSSSGTRSTIDKTNQHTIVAQPNEKRNTNLVPPNGDEAQPRGKKRRRNQNAENPAQSIERPARRTRSALNKGNVKSNSSGERASARNGRNSQLSDLLTGEWILQDGRKGTFSRDKNV
jgi:hypothetical protein